jgi:hypothetical protein
LVDFLLLWLERAISQRSSQHLPRNTDTLVQTQALSWIYLDTLKIP